MNQKPLFPDEPTDKPPDGKSDESRPKPSRAAIPDSGTDTSRAAGEQITPVAMGQVARVFHLIAGRGDEGATDHEIQAELGMTGDSERPRRWTLQRSGLVRDSGQRRKSPTGRDVIVWVAAADAVAGNQSQAS